MARRTLRVLRPYQAMVCSVQTVVGSSRRAARFLAPVAYHSFAAYLVALLAVAGLGHRAPHPGATALVTPVTGCASPWVDASSSSAGIGAVGDHNQHSVNLRP